MMDFAALERLERQAGIGSRILQHLASSAKTGLMIVERPDARVLLANATMSRILGCAGLQDGTTRHFKWEGFHSDGRSMGATDWPHARAFRGEEVAHPVEVDVVGTDGMRRLVEMTAVPVSDEAGQVLAAVLTCSDISVERRRFNARRFLADAGTVLSSSLDSVTILRNLARLAVPTIADWCAIDLVAEDGEIRRVAVEHPDRRKARAATEMARRQPTDPNRRGGLARTIREARAQLVADVDPATLDELADSPAYRRILETLGVCSVMLVPIAHHERVFGAMAFVSAESGRRYADDDLEVAEELAARAALAIENARLLEESRVAHRAKSDFLAVMSHELRTPLTAIIGYSELLQIGIPDPATPRQREHAERIEVSARHLLQLVEEILALVALGSGEDRVRASNVRIGELVETARRVIEPVAAAKGLQLRVSAVRAEAELPTDPDKLLQVLLNLLSNAVKFTESGEIVLDTKVSNDFVIFEVRDTGVGMGPEHVNRIFEPFWQVERPITRKAGGSGLGLTIVRRLVDLMGGEVAVTSEIGRGSCFSVRLPTKADLRIPEPEPDPPSQR